jgi:hypothetical protein
MSVPQAHRPSVPDNQYPRHTSRQYPLVSTPGTQAVSTRTSVPKVHRPGTQAVGVRTSGAQSVSTPIVSTQRSEVSIRLPTQQLPPHTRRRRSSPAKMASGDTSHMAPRASTAAPSRARATAERGPACPIEAERRQRLSVAQRIQLKRSGARVRPGPLVAERSGAMARVRLGPGP